MSEPIRDSGPACCVISSKEFFNGGYEFVRDSHTRIGSRADEYSPTPETAAAFLILKAPWSMKRSQKRMLTDELYCYAVLEEVRRRLFGRYSYAVSQGMWRKCREVLTRYWLEREKRREGVVELPLV